MAFEDILQQDETVEGRLGGLLEAKNPYIQQARKSGERAAARRGLLSSSIAAGSAEQAAISAALPIAQQSASQAFQRRTGREAFGQTQQLSRQEFEQTQQLQEGQFGFQREQQIRDIESKFGLTRLEAEEALRRQTQSEAAAAGLLGTEIAGRSALSQQEFGQTQQLTAQQIEANREAQLRQIEAQFGLSRQEAEQALAAQTQAEASRAGLSTQEAAQSQELAKLQGDIQQANLIAEYEQRGLLSTQEAQQQRDLLAAEYGFRSGMSQQEFTQQLGLQEQRFYQESLLSQQTASQNLELAQFNAESAQNLAQLETANRLLLQTSEDAQRTYTQLNNQISAIVTNPEMDEASKYSAINILIAYYNDYFGLQSELLSAGGYETIGQQVLGTVGPTGAVTEPPPEGSEGGTSVGGAALVGEIGPLEPFGSDSMYIAGYGGENPIQNPDGTINPPDYTRYP